MLKETSPSIGKSVEFDFLVCGELLCATLAEHLQEKGASTEETIDIEYLERFPAPTPQDCLMHDDWVSAVHAQSNWFVNYLLIYNIPFRFSNLYQILAVLVTVTSHNIVAIFLS